MVPPVCTLIIILHIPPDSNRNNSESKQFYSLRRHESENSDSGLVPDNIPMISESGEQSSYMYIDGDNVYLAGGRKCTCTFVLQANVVSVHVSSSG